MSNNGGSQRRGYLPINVVIIGLGFRFDNFRKVVKSVFKDLTTFEKLSNLSLRRSYSRTNNS